MFNKKLVDYTAKDAFILSICWSVYRAFDKEITRRYGPHVLAWSKKRTDNFLFKDIAKRYEEES